MNLFYELISDRAGNKLKQERKAWGMSRRKLAKLAYTDSETIEYIEKGYVCMLDFDLLRKICKVLQVSPFDFFNKTLTTDELLAIV